MKRILTSALLALMAGPLMADTPVTRLMDRRRARCAPSRATAWPAISAAPRSGIDYSRDWLAQQTVGGGDAQSACLAEALYFEARGESVRGQFAVAEVILNRASSAEFPDSVCDVIVRAPGASTSASSPIPATACRNDRQPAAFREVDKVARLMVQGAPRRLTDGATLLPHQGRQPALGAVFPRTTTIGVHHFYRKPTRLSQN